MTRDTTPTERRGYERPEQGDEWADAWDALVEDLDAESLYDEAGEIATANLSDDAVTAAKLAAAAVGTGELSDEAVTAAKIAAAAVDSGAIADGAVGVDELAAALGTSSDSPISGTVHLQDTVHESVSTDEASVTNAPTDSTDVARKSETDSLQADVDGKADEPHGSESHSADVVHDGEDATLGNTTHDSVSTESASVNGSLDANSANVESLTIGGKLFEEDANSPFTVSAESSGVYTIDGEFQEIIIIPERDNPGFDQLRVNQIDSNEYTRTLNNDDRTTGNTEWDFSIRTENLRMIVVSLNSRSSRANIRLHPYLGDGRMVWGELQGSVPSLDEIQLLDSGGSTQEFNGRVLGRVTDI